ncbi:ester cyclase [Roseomonas eburnea]|uniref:Ester cyclase n=1 Tax=Neoroseomonas eburnea TaxID=1346889 RepID=A0A9X9XCJ6_9PROT|nr:ester cyclase [Neoroseomonas eburnea]MBR0681432.1 ester cyclase [Neoroseomonas eburnea]
MTPTSTTKSTLPDAGALPRRFAVGAAIAAALGTRAAFGEPAGAVRLEANKAVIRRLIEGVQQDGDFDLFERLFAADYVDHTPFGGFPPNRDGTRAIYRMFRAAFPDWRAVIHRQVAEGDLVTTHKTYLGTHRGAFMSVAPTGRETTFDVMDIMRVRDGRITDHWTVADGAGLIRQITAPAR